MKTINIQPVEKKQTHDGIMLDVHSIFRTIQGEGPFTGHPAIFIRLAGCNLQCPSCDTEYTQGRKRMSYQEILEVVEELCGEHNVRLAVITGGEPFRQNITPLCWSLTQRARAMQVQVETNGSLAPSPGLPKQVTIVCSPKTGAINSELRNRVNAFKYVATWNNLLDDGLPRTALDHPCGPNGLARPQRGVPVYLQPQDDKDLQMNQLNLHTVVESCIKHGYILCLQTHKIANVE